LSYGKSLFPYRKNPALDTPEWRGYTWREMNLTLAHLSDTHLGFQDLDCVNNSGVNVREADVYAAWHEAVDVIVKKKPDVVVHTGDFFHRPCPSNRALIQGLAGLKQLGEAGIPVVIIAGNHSTPRTVYTSPILQSFRSLDRVHPIFEEKYECVQIAGALFHGVPHCNDEKEALVQMRLAVPVPGKINVLMLHTSVGVDYLMEEYGERVLPKELIGFLDSFSYTALGHFHSMKRINSKGRAWYSGAPERFSEKDAGKEKGFLFVTLAQGETPDVEFVPLPSRPWLRLCVENCADKTAEDVFTEIRTFAEGRDHGNAIVSIQLADLKPSQSLGIPNNDIAACFPNALTVQTRRLFREERFSFEHREIRNESLFGLFADYTRENSDSSADAKELLASAENYFAEPELSGHDLARGDA
jgi:exonuclease SbcD